MSEVKAIQVLELFGEEDDVKEVANDTLTMSIVNGEHSSVQVRELSYFIQQKFQPRKHDHLIEAVADVIAETKKGGGFTSEMRKRLENELKRLKGGSIG